jgi:hypothetical protein
VDRCPPVQYSITLQFLPRGEGHRTDSSGTDRARRGEPVAGSWWGDGTIGAQFLVGDEGFDADLAALPTGGYVATWQVGPYHVYARRLDSNGSLIGGPILVEDFDDYVFDPQAVGLSDGLFVITWGGAMIDSAGTIYSRWFDQGGNAAAAPVPIATSVVGFSTEDWLVTAPLGDGYVVAWWTHPELQIHGMVFEDATSATPADFAVTADFHYSPVIASLASQDPTFALASPKFTSALTPTVGVQRFDADGTPLEPEVELAGVDASRVEVAALPDGGFIVWDSYMVDSIDQADVHFQRFDQNGVKVGSETNPLAYVGRDLRTHVQRAQRAARRPRHREPQHARGHPRRPRRDRRQRSGRR